MPNNNYKDYIISTLKDLFKRFLLWRLKYISHRQFLLFLSVLVGFTSGLGAVVIKNFVHLIQSLLNNSFLYNYENLFLVVSPFLGILITVLIIKYIVRTPVEHGIPNTLHSISKRNSIMRQHNMYSSILTSSFTVGFGGSVGLEGPTVATGASIGSNIGRAFRLNYKNRTLLVGCAAAGAMSAIFKAPIAAIVFAFEVIMLDLTTVSLIPLLLASVSAVLTSQLFMGGDYLLHFTLNNKFEPSNILYYVLLGIITGFISLYFTNVYFYISHFFENKIKNIFSKVVIGGVALGLIIFLLPPLYGEGYSIINALIDDNIDKVFEQSIFRGEYDKFYVIFFFLLAIVFFKVVATAITFGSGGIGGIFAPTLFMGSTLGYLYAKTMNYLKLSTIPESNFTLVGMGGLMAGVLHAPLTAIFLIAEVTGGYELFVPLMLSAAISYSTVRLFINHSVYTQQLAERGELITHHKDKTVLTMMDLHKEIEENFITVHPEDSLKTLVDGIMKSSRNLFPVIDDENKLVGVVLLNDVRDIMFNRNRYHNTYVNELMTTPPAYIVQNEDMEKVVKKFEDTGAWNLPVVDENDKYVGFVSKSTLFSEYRKLLIEFSEE
ncbi:MAG: chloride channel protein [Flavobacteriales bacterium]